MAWKTAIAGGDDWQLVARSLLVHLGNLRGANFAFLYVTDELAKDTKKILTFLRRMTGIQNWSGGSNLAAFSEKGSLHGEPGAIVMTGRLPDGSVSYPDPTLQALQNQPIVLGIIHGDPRMVALPRHLQHLAEMPVFWSGGLMLNRGGHQVFRGAQLSNDELNLCCFDVRVRVAAMLFQGCRPFGDVHTITSSEGPMLVGLDHRPAMEVFQEDLTAMIAAQGAINPRSDDIHIGILSPGSDMGDYAVRGLSSIDPDQEFLNVAANLEIGQKIRFVQRSEVFAQDDMRGKLEAFRARLGSQKQKAVAAHYVSCMGRVPGLFNAESGDEMDYLRANLGDIPIIGYYALGEIMRGELHNFAGVLTVFLED